MSRVEIVSRVTPKHLRNKTKDEIISLFMLSLKENDELRGALEDLVDHQNGRPLETYTTWDDAMNKALPLIGRTSHKIVNGNWEKVEPC